MSIESDLAIVAEYYFSKRKRFFDILFSVSALFFLLPIFILICLCILVLTGHPIFFTQLRMGKQQKPFKIIKFRTMYVNAHQDQKKLKTKNQAPFPTFKIHDDPRFVGIGKFLSKTGLDELPQLINILKGEMSLIGPRPLPVEEAKKLPSHWQIRHVVRPGILSLWALSKDRHSRAETWKKLELETLQKSSIGEDLKILRKAVLIPFKYLFNKMT